GACSPGTFAPCLPPACCSAPAANGWPTLPACIWPTWPPAPCYCSDCCWPCTIACVRAPPTHVVKEHTEFMNAAKRLEIFRRLHEDNPDPKTELAYTTPFELLVAVTLSAQATDVGV